MPITPTENEESTITTTCGSPGTDPAGWSTDNDDDDDEVTSKTPAANTGGFAATINKKGSTAAPAKKKTSFECTWMAGSCTRTFPTHSRMRDHVRAVHRAKRFKCPGCVKSFTYKCDVKRHHNRRHKKEPPL
jgi:uncharacterized Zn-finger protein